MSLFGNVDLPCLEPEQQFFRRDVYEFQVVRQIEHPVRNGLSNSHTGNLADHIVEAFDVLNVQRRPDVDTGCKKLFHILPAFFMTTADRIRMGEFIHQQQVGDFEPGPHRHRSLAASLRDIRTDAVSSSDPRAVLPFPPAHAVRHNRQQPLAHQLSRAGRSDKHREGLSDTGGIPEKDFQRAAFRHGFVGLHLGQQFIRVRTSVGHGQFQFL